MRKTILVAAILLCAAIAFAQPVPAGTKEQPVATIQTTAGDMHCVLFPKLAPKGTANFIGLARGTKEWTDPKTGQKVHGKPLYDGTIFHRVIPEFMIQGGDPLGTGTGDPGYKFVNEVSSSVTFDRPGRLAYANSGPDTNGSQFFVTEVATPFLDGKYTLFGQCDDASVELVKKIARQPRGAQDLPNKPVVVKHIKIDTGAAPVHHPVAKPAAKPVAK
jgi:peptidyl-prolyl cis-trans isomerase A (cyclophilin A)